MLVYNKHLLFYSFARILLSFTACLMFFKSQVCGLADTIFIFWKVTIYIFPVTDRSHNKSIFLGKLRGKKTFLKHRRRLADQISLKIIGWVRLAHNSLMTMKNRRIYKQKHLDPLNNRHLSRVTTGRLPSVISFSVHVWISRRTVQEHGQNTGWKRIIIPVVIKIRGLELFQRGRWQPTIPSIRPTAQRSRCAALHFSASLHEAKNFWFVRRQRCMEESWPPRNCNGSARL
jgi:hypothetical protein